MAMNKALREERRASRQRAPSSGIKTRAREDFWEGEAEEGRRGPKTLLRLPEGGGSAQGLRRLDPGWLGPEGRGEQGDGI